MKKLKQFLLGLVFVGGVLGITNVAISATLQGYQGGTGYATTSPSSVGAYLTVASTSPFLTYTFSSGTAATNYWALNGSSLYPTSTSYNVGIGTTTPSALFVVGTTTNILTVTSAGKVGVGVSSPNATMDVFKSEKSVYGAAQYISDISEADATQMIAMSALSYGRQTTATTSPGGVTGMFVTGNDYYNSVDQTSATVMGTDSWVRHYGTKKLGTAKAVNTLIQTRDVGDINNAYNFYARGVQGVSSGRVTTLGAGFYSGADVTDGMGATSTYYHFYGNGNFPSYFGGFVGIGTTTPAVKLQVYDGNVRVVNTSATSTVEVRGSSNTRNSRLHLSEDGASGGSVMFDATNNDLSLMVGTSLETYTKALTIPRDTANIGIGTATPSTTLYVAGTSTVEKGLVLPAIKSGFLKTNSSGNVATSSLQHPIQWIIESPTTSENDAIFTFRATSTVSSCNAVNKTNGDTLTFGLGYSSSRGTATSSLTNMFAAQTVTATTTPVEITPTAASSTPGRLNTLIFWTTAASSTQFTLTCFYDEN